MDRIGAIEGVGIGADLRGVLRNASDRSQVLGGHTPTFDFDERALSLAVHLLASLTIDAMRAPDGSAEP